MVGNGVRVPYTCIVWIQSMDTEFDLFVFI